MRYGRPDDDLDPATVPGLAQLRPSAVKRVLQAGRVVRIPRGWTPIRAEEPSDEAYLLLEGCVEVVDGDQTLADVCQGEFVGEMGLVDHGLRSARVTVTEAVRAVAWPRDVFQDLRAQRQDFDALVSEVAHSRRERNAQRAS